MILMALSLEVLPKEVRGLTVSPAQAAKNI